MGKAYQVTAVHYDGDEISKVRLNDGQEISISQAIDMADRSLLEGMTVGGARSGRRTLHGVADGDPSNNLSNLPRF